MRLFLRLAAALLVTCPPAMAMTFQAAGTTLVMSGPVADGDLARLRDALAAGPIELVLLHDSSGGDLWNGLAVGEKIREEGLRTAVAGRCASACALMFLGGATRAFADVAGEPARLGLHGPHSRSTKQVTLRNAGRLSAYIERMTGDKYPRDLLEKTVHIRHARDIIYMYHPGRLAAGHGKVTQCLVGDDDKRDCRALEGFDPLEAGVVTTLSLQEVTPAAKALLRSGPAP